VVFFPAFGDPHCGWLIFLHGQQAWKKEEENNRRPVSYRNSLSKAPEKNMLKKTFGVLIFAILVISAAMPARAWDETGHKITAYIAWQQMTPETRDAVIKILRAAPEDAQLSTFYMGFGGRSEETRRREFFMVIASWADIIRDRDFEVRMKKYHHSNWHYKDTFWKTGADGKPELLPDSEDGGKAMEKLSDFDKVIRGSDPDKEKAIAIACSAISRAETQSVSMVSCPPSIRDTSSTSLMTASRRLPEE